MPGRSFGKHERLLKRCEFENVMNHGQRKKIGNSCTVFWLDNGLGHKRLGIIASKKVGNAVVRNYAKRRIREVFRGMKDAIQPARDIVVIVGKAVVELPFPVLEKQIAQSLHTDNSNKQS